MVLRNGDSGYRGTEIPKNGDSGYRGKGIEEWRFRVLRNGEHYFSIYTYWKAEKGIYLKQLR